MAKPYALFTYARNTREVLAGFSADAELMQNLTPNAAWALGKVEGSLENLVLLLVPPAIPTDTPAEEINATKDK